MPWYKEKTPLIAGLQLVAFFPYTIGVCARERVSANKIGRKKNIINCEFAISDVLFLYDRRLCPRVKYEKSGHFGRPNYISQRTTAKEIMPMTTITSKLFVITAPITVGMDAKKFS